MPVTVTALAVRPKAKIVSPVLKQPALPAQPLPTGLTTGVAIAGVIFPGSLFARFVGGIIGGYVERELQTGTPLLAVARPIYVPQASQIPTPDADKPRKKKSRKKS